MKISGLVFAAVAASALIACKDDKPAPGTAPSASAAMMANSAAPAAKAAAVKPDKAHKKSIPVAMQPHPVPADWTELSDDVRGFSFSLPKGSTGKGEDKNGVGVFVGQAPAPNDKMITMVMAYKDAKKTLDDLDKQAEELITKAMDEKDVKKGTSKDLSDDYRLTEFTSEDAKDSKLKSHWKVLSATDVTDNYLLVIGTPESEFKANEPTIDEIWGSFDMYSGGASGESH